MVLAVWCCLTVVLMSWNGKSSLPVAGNPNNHNQESFTPTVLILYNVKGATALKNVKQVLNFTL